MQTLQVWSAQARESVRSGRNVDIVAVSESFAALELYEEEESDIVAAFGLLLCLWEGAPDLDEVEIEPCLPNIKVDADVVDRLADCLEDKAGWRGSLVALATYLCKVEDEPLTAFVEAECEALNVYYRNPSMHTVGNDTWYVFDDDADVAEWAENYVREDLGELVQIPDHMLTYFDEDQWVADRMAKGVQHVMGASLETEERGYTLFKM